MQLSEVRCQAIQETQYLCLSVQAHRPLAPIKVRQAIDGAVDKAKGAAADAQAALQDVHDDAAARVLRFVEPLGEVRTNDVLALAHMQLQWALVV